MSAPRIEPIELIPGDFYFEGSRMVFTAQYLGRRGFCCGNKCRHCPYQAVEDTPSNSCHSGTRLATGMPKDAA